METGCIPIEQMQNRRYAQARGSSQEEDKQSLKTAYSPNGQYHGIVIRIAIIYWLSNFKLHLNARDFTEP